MAAAKRHKRVAASQPGFLSLKSDLDGTRLSSGRRKRVNKNKKKNWNKFSDIHDVEEFLDDVRLQERATGGLIADKPDDSLFFVDTGTQKSIPEPGAVEKKGKNSKPLRIDLILQPSSHIAPPKDILAHQRPNAKKERRMAQKAEKLAAMGVLPRRKKLLSRPAASPSVKDKPETSKDPDRNFYDLWSAGGPETADPYYLEQTKKKLVKRPEKLNEKPSVLPAVEVIAPGGSYNPDFLSHQALLMKAHEVEVQKLKAEEKLQRKLAINKKDIATLETTFKEQIEGLVEEDEEANQETECAEDDADVGAASQQEKKTEKQRKKEKAERIMELQKKAERKMVDSRQQLFKLRSISMEVKNAEQKTKRRQMQRKANQEAQKAMPRRLGKLKLGSSAQQVDTTVSTVLIYLCFFVLQPEGSVLKDRFKSLQKRNLIEPRERAKFKRKYKLKYVEKRAFKEIHTDASMSRPVSTIGRRRTTYMEAVASTSFHITVANDCSGVVPDCHGVTQNGSGSSSVTSPGFSLSGDAQRTRVWRHRGQHQDEQYVVTRPKGLVSLHLHPYRTICRNCVRMFKLHGMDYHRTPLGTSTAPYRDVWRVGLANTAAQPHHTERQTSRAGRDPRAADYALLVLPGERAWWIITDQEEERTARGERGTVPEVSLLNGPLDGASKRVKRTRARIEEPARVKAQ
ncbi:hypothetical protein NFI96_016765 [Prochilodus magdalenae]|nr:hypothetical protein NFI96_016765 [Prochilodus magdalenae]